MASEVSKTIGNQFTQWARCDVSASTVCTLQVTNLRNGVGREEMGDVESVARKVVGGLCYAGLLVASAIEALARIIISVPVIIYGCWLGEQKSSADEDKVNYLINLFFHGAIISGENALNCAMAIFQSIRNHDKPIAYDRLLGWEHYHDNVFDQVPFADKPLLPAGARAADARPEQDAPAAAAKPEADKPKPSAPSAADVAPEPGDDAAA